ncbi:MAG TPA: hypothetical protein VFC01_15455 [Mycobacterium sp.]|nr:hypothetical protein [Mycobacterium sp.]
MSTEMLLGVAAAEMIAVIFVFVVLADAAATRDAPDPVEPEPSESDERLLTAAEMNAVRAAFDQMLVRKGLVTLHQLDLIRHGTKSRGVVTGMRATGTRREDHREVELDVMVKKPGGGQFPAHETALIPASSLAWVSPGSIIDTYFRSDDESAVAVCVPPR